MGGVSVRSRKANGRSNHLIFRTFSVEEGQEELAVPILTFGELVSGKNLPKRRRCGL